jgi:hypothetical protein
MHELQASLLAARLRPTRVSTRNGVSRVQEHRAHMLSATVQPCCPAGAKAKPTSHMYLRELLHSLAS